MEHLNGLKLGIAAVVGALTGFWGWFGWLVLGWLACMMLDYLSGTMAAASKGQWASSTAREGIWHKTGMVIVVMVSGGADLLISTVLTKIPAIQLPIAYSGMLCPIVLCWYIITELGSIVENAVELGAPVPSWLFKLLAVGESALESAGDLVMGEEQDNGKQ